jgi:hypothetical protein
MKKLWKIFSFVLLFQCRENGETDNGFLSIRILEDETIFTEGESQGGELFLLSGFFSVLVSKPNQREK